MASFRKTGVNKPLKSSYINGYMNDTKFRSRSGMIIPNRVFVGGICPTATENDLLNLFAKYGAVKAVKIISDQNGSSKGYGFVTYEKPDDVTRLQNDAKNLMFNDRRLNIAPAVMKNPPPVNRFADSYIVPVTPSNIYFANNLQYQYQEGTSVFPNSPYAPPLTVLPAVSDAAYYQNGYSSSPNFVPTTPYQGAALFYPMPHNTSPVMVGPQSYNSSYQSVSASNSNFIYSSPAPATSSTSSTAAKTSTIVSTVTNTTEVHGSHGTQMVPTAPPNVSSVPPPIPYPLAHPPQYYNGHVAPPYSGEVYYNMIQGCYPVMTVGGHDAYIPYYDVPETCSNNVSPEENHFDSQNYHQTSTNVQNYADVNGKESSPPNQDKLIPMALPPTSTEHLQETYETTTVATPQTPAHAQHTNNEYNPNYIQHRSAIIYPNPPMPPNNIYFNSVYMTDATTPALTQSPYPKNLSEHYVSDHLPKRDSKYQKKFSTSPQKDSPAIPNIPKFPFYMNNNYPGFVNRNVKEKDYKNGNGKIIENKQPPRVPRSNSNGSGGPRPRVFHNQNQYNAGTRPPRSGNGVPNNAQYPRSNSAGSSRPYEPAQPRPYEYQNNYQGLKNGAPYENKKQANGGYRVKYEKVNGQGTNEYTKNQTDERPKKYAQNEDTTDIVHEQNVQVQQQVCSEMQNLTL